MAEYLQRETLVLGEPVTLYSPDGGWRWFSCLEQLHAWKRKHDAFDGDFSWKATHTRRVSRKKKKTEEDDL